MAAKSKITLQDVATAAGVSKATASKALRGDYPVSEDTRQRVSAAAERLGFTHSVLATSLSTGRSSTVGLVVLDSRLERFVSPISFGVEDALRSIDLALILANARGDRARLEVLLKGLAARQLDGLIVVGDNNSIVESVTDRIAVPVVYAYCQTDRPSDVCHLPDDRLAVNDLANALIESGRTRIAHITGPRRSLSVQQRLAGLRQALRGHNMRLCAAPMHGGWSQNWGSRAVARLVQDRVAPDAIVCGSDQIAYGVLTALTSLGEQVPDEVAVTGFDNWRPFAEESQPPLTTIDSNLELLGAASAHDLFTRIDGTVQSVGQHRHPCSLVVRGSTPAVLSAASGRRPGSRRP